MVTGDGGGWGVEKLMRERKFPCSNLTVLRIDFYLVISVNRDSYKESVAPATDHREKFLHWQSQLTPTIVIKIAQ
jgi:hypothetical protein